MFVLDKTLLRAGVLCSGMQIQKLHLYFLIEGEKCTSLESGTQEALQAKSDTVFLI